MRTLLLDARLGLREGLAAEAIDLGRALAAREFLDLVQAIDGQVELVAAGVLDDEEIDGDAADVLVDEAEVLADAVLDVDDEVADGEAPQVFEEGARRSSRSASARAARRWARAPKISSSVTSTRPSAGATTPRASEPTTTSACAVASASSSTAGSKAPRRAFTRSIAVPKQRDEALDLRLGARGEDDAQSRPLARRRRGARADRARRSSRARRARP